MTVTMKVAMTMLLRLLWMLWMLRMLRMLLLLPPALSEPHILFLFSLHGEYLTRLCRHHACCDALQAPT